MPTAKRIVMHARRGETRALGLAAAVLAAVALTVASPARAQDPDCATQICDPAGAPPPACEVTGAVSPRVIADGATVDCTGFDVTVKGFGKIQVDDGSFTLKADSLTVIDGGIIEAREVNGTGSLGFGLQITGQADIYGNLQADGASGGGDITLDAGGAINLFDAGNKGIEVSGTAAGASGGSIDVSSGASILISNPVRASAGGTVDAQGGQITMRAGTDIIVTTSSGRIHADGQRDDAGEIRLTAGGDISFDTSSSLSADGHGIAGNGGGIYMTAGNLVSLGTAVSARGGIGSGGNEAVGGSLAIESGCGGVSIAGNLDLRGGEFGGGYDGGSLEIDTKGDLTVSSGVLIDTHGVGNGSSGGDVELESGGKITLSTGATIDAHGDTSDPNGEGLAGSVELLACDIEVASGVTINAAGVEGGTIDLATQSPATNTTTLHVAGSSTLDASGTSTFDEGRIHVAVTHEVISGVCETDPTRACTLDADCTVGCTTGQCQGLNPDTDDVLSQFLTAPDMEEDNNLAACTDTCAP